MSDTDDMPVMYPPTRADPAVGAEVSKVLPCPECRAANEHVWPVMGLMPPFRYACMCHQCKFIGDDGADVAEAVRLWNFDPLRRSASRLNPVKS